MVLSDVNGNGKKSSAAERWMRQRNGQRASAVRCIFGPPEKRAHLMIIMRNEAEMERKRIEFAARYEPVGLSPNERRNFYDGLVKSSPTSNRHYQQQQQQNNGKSRGNVRARKILFVKISREITFRTRPLPQSWLHRSYYAPNHKMSDCVITCLFLSQQSVDSIKV